MVFQVSVNGLSTEGPHNVLTWSLKRRGDH